MATDDQRRWIRQALDVADEASGIAIRGPSEAAIEAAQRAYFAGEPGQKGSAEYACMEAAISAAYAIDAGRGVPPQEKPE